MRVNRKLIYAGVFLVAVGAVLVATDLGDVATAALRDALRFWPVAIVAIGLALVLRRTPAALPAGIAAAVVPGLLLGGFFAVAPRYGYDCGSSVEPGPATTQAGTFDGPASVSVRTGCGALTITTQAGSGWQLTAASSTDARPDVAGSPNDLAIQSAGDDSRLFRGGRDAWQLALPAANVTTLDVDLEATHTDVSLPGTTLDDLSVKADLSDVTIDASEASISSLDVRSNLSSVSIRLSDAVDLSGSLQADVASIVLCLPPDLGLQITSHVSASSISVGGLEQNGSTWTSPNYDTASHHADIVVRASLASVAINPNGGCK